MLSYIFMKILEGRPRSYDRLMDKVSRGQVKTVKEAVVAEVPEDAHVLEMGCALGPQRPARPLLRPPGLGALVSFHSKQKVWLLTPPYIMAHT